MDGIVEVELDGWPAGVSIFYTTRSGGLSEGPYASFNLGAHVGDKPHAVYSNRRLLVESVHALTGVPVEFAWLNQVHGIRIVRAADSIADPLDADASWTDKHGLACAVMTADCVPVLLTNQGGSLVAAAHAGWRGLADGVLDSTLSALAGNGEILAWVGPSIGPAAFQVGGEVRDAFLSRDSSAESFFLADESVPGKYRADLGGLVVHRLNQLGITKVSHLASCTYSNPGLFYSHRRDGVSGRQASFIFLRP